MPRRLPACVLLAAWLVPAAHAAGAPARILYAGDWVGPTQIFAADPAGRAPLGQVTFARPEPCGSWPAACGYTDPLPSPDGRLLAYRTASPVFDRRRLWLARGDGTGARALAPSAFGAAWAPDSRRLAYGAADGVHVLAVGTGGDRVVDRRRGVGFLAFSPDGRTLALGTGDELVLLRRGHERVLARKALGPLAWSPDGRRIAYSTRTGVSLADVASGRARRAYRAREQFAWVELGRTSLAWSPDGRRLAFTVGSIHLLDTRTLRARTLRDGGHDLAWSPDGKRLLYVQYGESTNGDSISTGEVRTVTPGGRVRTVVAASRPYGGQLVAAAWARTPPGLRYRAPQRVDGVFAGGPVQELAADGGRVAFVSCAAVSAWTPATGAVVAVTRNGDCPSVASRQHVYSLGLAGDRVVWWEKSYGLCFQWVAREATIGSAALELGRGYGCLGGPPVAGSGTAVGAGPLLVRSSWTLASTPTGLVVSRQAVERVEPGGCPCPELSSSPGLYEPLDVDAGRIVVSGENETRILAADGSILLSLRVPTLAAQLDGSALALVAGGELRVYDAGSGLLRAVWPLPAAPAGHDCDLYGDPVCLAPRRLTLGGLARGLAAYVVDGEVHLLRLADGADRDVGPGTLARFVDAGLVFADGARIRLVPWERLLP